MLFDGTLYADFSYSAFANTHSVKATNIQKHVPIFTPITVAAMCSRTGSRVLRILTGGAVGADYAWLEAFAKRSTSVKATMYTFHGHNAKAPHNICVSHKSLRNVDEIDDAQKACTHAARCLKKRFNPLNVYTSQLLMRNFLLARDATCILAVGKLMRASGDHIGFCGVGGGTGWTCQMFHDLLVKEGKEGPIPMYIYDIETNIWMQCSLPTHNDVSAKKLCTWTQVDISACLETVARNESSRIGVIGTRDMQPAAVEAITITVDLMCDLIENEQS
jgi:hypothetical protein